MANNRESWKWSFYSFSWQQNVKSVHFLASCILPGPSALIFFDVMTYFAPLTNGDRLFLPLLREERATQTGWTAESPLCSGFCGSPPPATTTLRAFVTWFVHPKLPCSSCTNGPRDDGKTRRVEALRAPAMGQWCQNLVAKSDINGIHYNLSLFFKQNRFRPELLYFLCYVKSGFVWNIDAECNWTRLYLIYRLNSDTTVWGYLPLNALLLWHYTSWPGRVLQTIKL